jgi:hypothetical protein
MRAGGEWLTLDDAEEREERENGAKGLTLYGDRWRTAGELGPLRERDRQAAGWDLVARVDQAPFVLFSDRPTRDVRKLARLIADEVRAYREFYGKAWELKDLPARFTVHAFGDRATFDRVAGKAYGSPIHPGMAGLYQRGKPVLFAMVGDAKSDPGFAHTAVHELFHALDDLCARRVGTLSSLLGVTFPTWVREGRAEHFGFSAVGGRVLVGSIGPRPGSTVHQGLADALANVPLEAFLDYDERRFYERSAFAHVCLSWALAHFLFHGEGGRHASGFRTFLARLPRRGSREDLEAAVGPLASWSRAFEAHARELIRIVEGTR